MLPPMADSDSRTGARYADAAILDWTANLHAPHDTALDAAFRASETDELPAIQIGPSEGKLLYMLAKLIGARSIVEIGTLGGYSAIWLARALPPGGKLYTLELEPRYAEVARRNLEAAGVGDRVEILVGDARQSLERLKDEGPFCMVFVDADKAGYPDYGRFAREHLRTGGLLVGDNAYLFGDLLDPESPTAEAMRTFHEEMRNSFESVCIPTPDGLTLGTKIS
jgi:predicted O-methyltransferase YrrM